MSRTAADDPFEPIGLRVGAFVLRPAIEAKTGYDTNPNRIADGRGSRLWMLAPEVLLRSDWQRHELRAEMRGNVTEYDRFHSVNTQSFEATVDGRIDVTRNARLDLQGRARTVSASAGNIDLPADLARLPRQSTLGASVGVGHRFNRLEMTAKGSLDRITWNPSLLTDGTSVSNKDRNYDQHGALLRGSYELTPGVKPFFEVGFDTRRHALSVDAQGIARDSDGRYVKVGTSFELTRKLTGEAAIGHLGRSYVDPTLPDLRGLLADASLVWTATALTTVKFTARTSAEETILRGVSGMLVREGELSVDHAFRRWLVGTLKVGYGTDHYVGSNLEIQRSWAAAAVTYKMSRNLQFKGEVRHEWRESNVLGGDYSVTTLLAGVRLQH